jgi:hypothetical protein
VSVKIIESHRAQFMERLEIYDVVGRVRHVIHRGRALPDE